MSYDDDHRDKDSDVSELSEDAFEEAAEDEDEDGEKLMSEEEEEKAWE